MVGKFLATDIEGIEGIGAVGAVFEEAFFGFGFFRLLNQNDRLTEVEWPYRRERTSYINDEGLQILRNYEKDFLTGTSQEQDSIKN